MTTIVVGDWLVAGTTTEDRDVGRIVALDGDVATVAWDTGVATSCEIGADDVEVYAGRSDAEARRGELDGEARS